MRSLFPLVCIAAVVADNKDDDLVTALPGFDAELPSKHYSGYLPVAEQSKRIHYYLQEADEAPESKPLLLWLNGGPGSSSLIGALTELGQLIFNRDSMAGGENGVPKLFRNPNSWTTVANVLYFESPAGVGFSYCVDHESKCVNTDTSTAQDNHEALTSFLKRFPEYEARGKYLTGESYAGMYLPMLMQQIEQHGEVQNVKGIAIGNGCWGTVSGTNCGDFLGEPGLVFKSDVEYLTGRGLVSHDLKAAADAACGDWSDPLPKACERAYEEAANSVGSINVYNTDNDCPTVDGDHRMTLSQVRRSSWRERSERRQASVAAQGLGLRAALAEAEDEPLGEIQMWCGNEHASDVWMAVPAVQEALHVVGGQHKMDYEIERLDLSSLYNEFAFERPGLNFLIYNGLSDDCVPFTSQDPEHWVPANTTTVEAWRPWTLPSKSSTLGHVRTYSDSFRFATVWGAGHMVPRYRPHAALSMIQQFLLHDESEEHAVLV